MGERSPAVRGFASVIVTVAVAILAFLAGRATSDSDISSPGDAPKVLGTSVTRPTSTTPGATTTVAGTAAMPGMGDEVADRPTIAEFSGTERSALAAQLAKAREVALRYPTLADAAAAGFEPTTPFTPGLGAHMGRDDWTQPPGQALDIERPQSYLYDGTTPDSQVVGLMYVQMGGSTPPDGFAGPLDPWHAFVGQCLKATEYDPLFPAQESVTKQQCDDAGGRYIDVTAWIQHVWVVPGYEAPGGVFAAANSDIVCEGRSTKVDPVTGCASPVRP